MERIFHVERYSSLIFENYRFTENLIAIKIIIAQF